MIQVNRIYLIFNRLVTKKFLVDTSEKEIKRRGFPLLHKEIYITPPTPSTVPHNYIVRKILYG